jgi:hypothetical protein
MRLNIAEKAASQSLLLDMVPPDFVSDAILTLTLPAAAYNFRRAARVPAALILTAESAQNSLSNDSIEGVHAIEKGD